MIERAKNATQKNMADSDPATDAEAIVIGTDFSRPGFVDFGADCDCTVITVDGTTIQFKGRKAGTQLPVICTQVSACTSTDIIAIF